MTTIAFGGEGVLEVDGDAIVTNPAITFSVLEDAVDRAPTTITVSATGGDPLSDFTIEIDGTLVLTGAFDSDGAMGLTSIWLSADLGTAGSHTAELSTLAMTGDTVAASDTFIVVRDPVGFPVGPNPDVPPAPVSGSVKRWVFQDPAPGGLGSWIMPANPRTMTSPHFEKNLKSRHTTAPNTGQYHVTEGGQVVKQWTFGGYTPYEVVQEKLLAYRALNRRIYIIDHHGRAWKVVIEHVEITARLQQIYANDPTDWGADWQVTATIVDQNWTVPA